MKGLHIITFLLVIIGALNWWLVGVFDFNLVSYILWDMTMASRVVYTLVGLSAIIEIFSHPSMCKMCKK